MEDRSSSASPTARRRWSVGDLIRSLLDDMKTPRWPPDCFAVAATLLAETGAYVVATEKGSVRGPHSWERLASRDARTWRESVRADTKYLSVLSGLSPPESIVRAWNLLLEHQSTLLPDVIDNRKLSMALVDLLCIADEASSGFGISEGGVKDAALIQLRLFNGESMTHRVNTDRARVLPKQHTPQNGLTLRSLTHNLALVRPRGVNVRWVSPVRVFGDSSEREIINMLLVPWPETVREEDFHLVNSPPGHNTPKDSRHRFFEFNPYRRLDSNSVEQRLKEFRKRFERLVVGAQAKCEDLHIAVFPELALSKEEYDVAREVSFNNGIALVAGVRHTLPDGSCGNACVTDLTGLTRKYIESAISKNALSGFEDIQKSFSNFFEVGQFLQFKHHRWSLDRGQIIQYGLGSRLPVSRQCWEWSPILRRSLNFLTVDNWLTWTTLICEDLARQDPVGEIVRTVGPNLVIALLMDGPQLPFRWPARYATVLADDPGSAVLTLTSIGMVLRSNPLNGDKPSSRTVALWRDAVTGHKELCLPEGASGLVLSLSPDSKEEWTADGRGDGGVAFTPVFAGVTPVST